MIEQILDYIVNSLLKYYGTDWVALLFLSLGSYFIAQQKRIGCLFMGVGCASGFLAALISGQVGFLFGNAFQIIMMTYGFINWNKAREQKQADKPMTVSFREPRTYP